MVDLLISKAPEDPDEKKEWARAMLRIQAAMWIDDKAKCLHCGKVYKSVDDFIARNPYRGHGEEMTFIDFDCWVDYNAAHQDRGA